jgi:diketogulonate reductase-like aldo/keto reductase
MKGRLLNRREFTGLCATSLISAGAVLAASSSAPAQNAAPGAAPTTGRTVKFRDGTIVPALGQGSARLGRGKHPQAAEEEALRTGLALGMTLIDTAEMYGSEEFIGRAIPVSAIVSSWSPKSGRLMLAEDGIARAPAASLTRLGTDHLDLYFFTGHKGRGSASIVAAFEACARREDSRLGRVQLHGARHGRALPRARRRPLRDQTRSLTASAIEGSSVTCCPGASGMACRSWPVRRWVGRRQGADDPTLARIAAAHGCSAAAVALAWAIRGGNVIAIPESGSVAHVKENAVALSLTLTPQELQVLDAANPLPPGSYRRG